MRSMTVLSVLAATLGGCDPCQDDVGVWIPSGLEADCPTEIDPTAPPAADDPYADWWLCANACPDEDAGCVDACTDDFNRDARHEVQTEMIAMELTGASCRTRTGERSDAYAVRCPDGYELQPFDMPIYDEEGLFVIGHETVWFCIDPTAPPAG